jgi:hypothetical protein
MRVRKIASVNLTGDQDSGPSGLCRVGQRPEAGQGLSLVLKARNKFEHVQYAEHFQHVAARM